MQQRNSPKICPIDKICPKSTPDVIPKGQRTPIAPLSGNGANSVKYIGITQVTNP